MTDRPKAGEESFAEMLSQHGGVERVRVAVGDRVRATIIHVSDTTVFCELSRSQEASIPRESLVDDTGQLAVGVGDVIDAFVVRMDDGIELAQRLGRERVDVGMLQEAARGEVPVQGTVTGINKGGLEVSIGGARGFCPIGQVDVEFVEDPQSYVGKSLEFLVREVRQGGRNVLLSRRALLDKERRALAEKTLASLAEGDEVTGTVSRVVHFGAFVDLGGIDGLIPMSELSHQRIGEATEVVQVGEAVTVKVLRIEDDPKRPQSKRIALSLKAATADPFDAFAASHGAGDVVQGTVAKIEAYGAFVELAPGISGLAHISELAGRRIGHPKEVVDIGQAVTGRILGIDAERRRIALSLKDAPSSLGTPPEATLQIGAAVDGTVDRIERYGVFLTFEGGGRALMPAAESGTPRGTDLGRAFPMGSKVAVRVTAIDERGRVEVSKRARERQDERADLDAYRDRSAAGTGFSRTLGDLLKKR